MNYTTTTFYRESGRSLGESIKYLGERFLGPKSKLNTLSRCENSYDKKEREEHMQSCQKWIVKLHVVEVKLKTN